MKWETIFDAIPKTRYECKHCHLFYPAGDLRFWEPPRDSRRGADVDPGFYCAICLNYEWWHLIDSDDDIGPTLAEVQEKMGKI